MKARRSSRPGDREGYVSLLAVTFAFGLATLGTAVAVSVRAYLAAAVHQEEAILDRIALETATNLTLGRLSRAGVVSEVQTTDAYTAGRRVSVALSSPGQKIDLIDDADKDIDEALREAGIEVLRTRWDHARASGGMALFSSRLGLTTTQEDCVRRVTTFGRAPAPLETGAFAEGRTLAPGEQVDVRAEVIEDGARAVLWTRARFTGSETTPWLVHDYRRLMGEPAACQRSPR